MKLKHLLHSISRTAYLTYLRVSDVRCTPERPCVNCFLAEGNCLKTIDGHNIACLYQHFLSSAGVRDTPDTRKVFWGCQGALQWEHDQPVTPELDHDKCPCCKRM